MEYEIVPAKEEDREEILALYEAQKGREFCPWDDDIIISVCVMPG